MRPVVSALMLTLLLGVANLLAALWTPAPWDVTAQGRHTLSTQTRNVLARLEGQVEITVLLPDIVRTTDERSFDRAVGPLRELLQRYRDQSPVVTIHELNGADSAAAYQIKQRFPDAVVPCVLVTYAGSEGETRHEVLRHQDLLELHGSEGRLEQVDLFAERAVTGALLRLVSDRPQTIVYCLAGHGELSLEEAPGESRRSISQLADYLAAVDVELRKLELTEGTEVPADADVVLIAGPVQPLSVAERAKLSTYLKHGGSALVLMDDVPSRLSVPLTPSSWESWLANYGVVLGRDFLVTDLAGGDPMTSVSALPEIGEYPILRDLPRASLKLARCRSVRLQRGTAGRNVSGLPLLLSPTAPRTWAERTLASTAVPAFDPEEDLPGPVSMGVLIDRLDRSSPEAMMIVVGDSGFAANRGMTGPHSDAHRGFMLSAVSHLAGRREIMADVPMSIRSRYQLSGSAESHRRLVWIAMLVLSAAITTAGATVWTIRRGG